MNLFFRFTLCFPQALINLLRTLYIILCSLYLYFVKYAFHSIVCDKCTEIKVNYDARHRNYSNGFYLQRLRRGFSFFNYFNKTRLPLKYIDVSLRNDFRGNIIILHRYITNRLSKIGKKNNNTIPKCCFEKKKVTKSLERT